MYTQCPECGVAFRVTAEVLKMAAGKVRCGGCGIAFNALDYLSEQKPAATPAPATDGAVPELTPDSAELEPVEPPKTVSAEQGAALLKTLDELAGSDIRIEDTGVEWRVLDEDEEEVADELQRLLDFVLMVLRDFGFEEFEADLSTRDENKMIGDPELWDIAEEALAA